jgi:hypothetical protein
VGVGVGVGVALASGLLVDGGGVNVGASNAPPPARGITNASNSTNAVNKVITSAKLQANLRLIRSVLAAVSDMRGSVAVEHY